MPIKYMGQCSEHKASFVPNICSEVELFRTYKLPSETKIHGPLLTMNRPTMSADLWFTDLWLEIFSFTFE